MIKEISLKIIIVGDTFTGKTCIMNRYINDDFSSHTESTVGSTSSTKEISFNNIKYILNIWDTAGQEQFHSIIPVYFRDANAAIIVFDVSNPKSFHSIEFWKKMIHENEPNCNIIAICANKIDLWEKQQDNLINTDAIIEVASTLDLPYFECSAATGEGVIKLFQTIFSDIISQQENNTENSSPSSGQPAATTCHC